MQAAPHPPPTVVLTGASRGIGRATALALAAKGASLVLVVRDRVRGEAVAAEARAVPGAGPVRLVLADLASMREVARAGDEIRELAPRIDVLLHNAGVMLLERHTTVDGLEATFATNHLAPFVLTRALFDRVRASAPARVVCVSSIAHWMAPIDFDDLQAERRFSGFLVYGRSKLANILFTRQLAKKLAGTTVTANALHPGAVASHFGRESGKGFGWLMRAGAPFLLSEEKGARTSIWSATAPELAGVTGKYFTRCREARTSAAARDEAAAARLWDASEALVRALGLPPPPAGW